MDEKCNAVSYLKAATAVVLITLFFSACAAANEKPNNEDETAEKKVKDNVYLEDQNVGGLKESEVLEIIRNIAAKTGSKPEMVLQESKNEQDKSNTSMKKINIEKTLQAVLNAREGERVDVVMEPVAPNDTVTQKKAQKDNTPKEAASEKNKASDQNKTKKQNKSKSKFKLIAKSTTPLLDKSESRLNNIYIASEKIDKKVIYPGEEFSFNAVVGRRTEAKGYEEAPIIIRTEKGPKKDYDIGGGICQISTTLYNAAEEAGLKITERHVHSKDVGYVEKGEDATVSYGTMDFRFVNNRKNPIVIRILRGKNTLTVKLYEKRD